MNIGFILPGSSRFPCGGFKVVFEYANYFVSHGHNVTIYFNCINGLKRFHLPEFLRKICNTILVRKRPIWFDLHPSVRKVCVFGIRDETIADGDAIFATAVETAIDVANLSHTKGKKYYLIQGYENWNITDDEVKKTYQLGMTNIVVSKWLFHIVNEISPAVLISNSINGDVFNVQMSIENRCKKSMIFHWRKSSYKGGVYALKLINKLRDKYPDFKFTAVSSESKPRDFPSYISYVHNASPKQVARLNNQHTFFVCTSVAEGFGLPGLEGMACGCALVSSGYQGVYDYAIDGVNALISPVKDVDSMFHNVEKLLEDDELRIRIARAGNECAIQRTLDIAGKQLEQLLLS